ncbi:MAG: T9SS type A sorting domain-containing protein [Ignavibacteria bacterium]|nr:T9SS type A sorting domain-containing protein [Ignavibacteria bacterium]
MARSPGFTLPLLLDDTTIQPDRILPGLPRGTTVFWRVLAFDSTITTGWSASRSFTTMPAPLASPLLDAPVDASRIFGSDTTLRWNSVTGAARYLVQVWRDSVMMMLHRDTLFAADPAAPFSSCRIGGLARNVKFWWYVRAFDDCGGYAASALWTFTTDVNTEAASPQAHAGFALRQNTPNPFSDATTIAFTLSTAARAVVRVYDALGREVAVLTDADLPAGAHAVQWRTADLPPGVYVARLQAGTFSATRGMLLAR